MNTEFFHIPPAASTAYGDSYIWWKDGFSFEELAKLNSQLDALPHQQAVVAGANEGPALTSIRRSQVAWVPLDEPFQWLYQRLGNIVAIVNRDYFGFDLTGVFKLQHTVYESGDSGHYDWHVDMMGKNQIQRKLSFVMMLSDAMEYEGGELWVHNYNRIVAEKAKGRIHFFPSFCLHKVTPVTKGIRKTLVGWCVGPNFR